MVTPNIWGQGQLFAFSALDGGSFAREDFVGTLSGDKIGIRFHTKVIRELAVVKVAVNLLFDVLKVHHHAVLVSVLALQCTVMCQLWP